MINNTYHHTYYQDRTSTRGYTWETKPLPHYLHITISNDGDSKQLYIHSIIHANKTGKVGCSYSTDFTDQEIIKDQSSLILSRWA